MVDLTREAAYIAIAALDFAAHPGEYRGILELRNVLAIWQARDSRQLANKAMRYHREREHRRQTSIFRRDPLRRMLDAQSWQRNRGPRQSHGAMQRLKVLEISTARTRQASNHPISSVRHDMTEAAEQIRSDRPVFSELLDVHHDIA